MYNTMYSITKSVINMKIKVTHTIEEEINEYIKDQPNQSSFIENLVKAYRDQNDNPTMRRALLQNEVEKAMIKLEKFDDKIKKQIVDGNKKEREIAKDLDNLKKLKELEKKRDLKGLLDTLSKYKEFKELKKRKEILGYMEISKFLVQLKDKYELDVFNIRVSNVMELVNANK